jgi:NADPH-dependent 2,4-dienoyl-CoA reductase/sulfur reductase-like enzyme
MPRGRCQCSPIVILLLEKVTDGTKNRRPRVLILGGGFAGIGAARSLRDADVDVVLVDKHDYHTKTQ